ncbi:ATP-dependent RNA helicase RhlB [Marinobacter daqiaonensis]|uniref:ATP-dependent RNA helicase RhlB n=1 Tax=Marinobacter daqiaonensis TaxID=650891 RepID=A0A1I6H2N4_9GAMM|nr:DEAD/DEAH box helicase [Marinobacter daqiaonensis]SFR48611.1 ATP-dependent RNA helicase RhlB [Marinobacter daqiaonensis]
MTQSPESTATSDSQPDTEASSQAVEGVKHSGTRFADLRLDKRLLDAINGIGFEYCTPIQAETLPYTLACHDLIGQAQTGTGKTAAFLITAIQTLLETPIPDSERFASEPRVLALAPTRELAMQIAKDAEQLCDATGHRVVSVVGGMNYDKQRDVLQNEIVDILVATPGRLIDFLGSQDVFLDQVDLLILDEADRMLDMGFIPDVKRIIRRCPPKDDRQTLLFSATFNQDVLNLASMWTHGAEFIEIEPQQKTAERVKQTVYLVSEEEKLPVLVNYLKRPEVEKAIVFANRRDQCRDLEEDLKNQGVKVALMSGEIAQNKRLKTLDQFKNGEIQVLVATDVAGRGIHVEGVTHVFNYNLPDNAEDYVHRIGRTGRAGEHGVSISFASEDDSFALPSIETYISQKLETTVPDEELMQPLEKPPIQRRRGARRSGGGPRGGNRGRQGQGGRSRPRQ